MPKSAEPGKQVVPQNSEQQQARLRVHLQLIDDGVRPVMDRYREHVQCKAGCSDCCHQTFRISEIEGESMKLALAELPDQTRQDILRRARAYEPDTRTPCPVLSEEGRCRLYEARPRICRKYGIPLWHPDRPHEVKTCPLNFQGVDDIDAKLILDPQARWAEDWIKLRDELNLEPKRDDTIASWLLVEASADE